MKRLLFCAFLGSGCVGTDVGNPQTDSDLDLTFSIDVETQTQIQGLHQNGIHLTKVQMILESVELQKGCDDERIVSKGPFVIDLLEETTITLLNSGPGTYCRVAFHFGERTKSDSTWLVLDGSVGEDVEFRIEGKRHETLTINGNSNLFLDADGTSLNLSFAIFQALETINSESDSPVLISEDSNIPLYNTIRQEIRNTARLFKDNNRNQVVDADERTPVGLPIP